MLRLRAVSAAVEFGGGGFVGGWHASYCSRRNGVFGQRSGVVLTYWASELGLRRWWMEGLRKIGSLLLMVCRDIGICELSKSIPVNTLLFGKFD